MTIREIEAEFWLRPLTREEITRLEAFYEDESEASVCHECGDVDWYCDSCGFHGHDCNPIKGEE